MIRKACPSDRDAINEIYDIARRFMAQSGNPTQWGSGYPPLAVIDRDIQAGHSYVYETAGRLQAVFAMIPGEDPDYAVIDGAWQNDSPYCAVHRIASRGEIKGIASQCLTWALAQCGNVRIDTHLDNLPMQRVLEKLGFLFCGTVFHDDGTSRIAYQMTLNG